MSEFSNASRIARMQDALDKLREEFDAVKELQDENSDEANEDKIEEITYLIETLDGVIGDLVP
jgi:hypothetical protein